MIFFLVTMLGNAEGTKPVTLALDDSVDISHLKTGGVKPLAGHQVVLSIDDGHRSVYQTVYPMLKRYRMTATLAVIVNTLTGQGLNYKPNNNSYYVTRGEIKEMIDSCDIEIASHTLSHPWLTNLDSARAWDEIYRSRMVLESLFGVAVVTFVYPYGDMDSRIRRLVERAGYRVARAVRRGEVNFWLDPYRLPEFELRQEVGLDEVKSYISNHKTSILLLHRIVANPRVFTEWSAKDFEGLLAWLDEMGVKTVRVADLYYDWRREVVEKLIFDFRSVPGLFEAESLFKDVDIDATRTFHPR
ncbi:MAG: polysaccharide deacetylase family protein [bacterium]